MPEVLPKLKLAHLPWAHGIHSLRHSRFLSSTSRAQTGSPEARRASRCSAVSRDGRRSQPPSPSRCPRVGHSPSAPRETRNPALALSGSTARRRSRPCQAAQDSQSTVSGLRARAFARPSSPLYATSATWPPSSSVSRRLSAASTLSSMTRMRRDPGPRCTGRGERGSVADASMGRRIVKAAPSPSPGLEPLTVPPCTLDQAPHQGQSESQPAFGAIQRLLCLREGLEENLKSGA